MSEPTREECAIMHKLIEARREEAKWGTRRIEDLFLYPKRGPMSVVLSDCYERNAALYQKIGEMKKGTKHET
mgnify:FL=1